MRFQEEVESSPLFPLPPFRFLFCVLINLVVRMVSYGPTKTSSEEEEQEWKEDKYSLAIVALKKALVLLPEETKPVTLLASLYNKRKDFDSAIALYNDLHKVNLVTFPLPLPPPAFPVSY